MALAEIVTHLLAAFGFGGDGFAEVEVHNHLTYFLAFLKTILHEPEPKKPILQDLEEVIQELSREPAVRAACVNYLKDCVVRECQFPTGVADEVMESRLLESIQGLIGALTAEDEHTWRAGTYDNDIQRLQEISWIYASYLSTQAHSPISDNGSFFSRYPAPNQDEAFVNWKMNSYHPDTVTDSDHDAEDTNDVLTPTLAESAQGMLFGIMLPTASGYDYHPSDSHGHYIYYMNVQEKTCNGERFQDCGKEWNKTLRLSEFDPKKDGSPKGVCRACGSGGVKKQGKKEGIMFRRERDHFTRALKSAERAETGSTMFSVYPSEGLGDWDREEDDIGAWTHFGFVKAQ